jgi:uncharacterized protein YkwD
MKTLCLFLSFLILVGFDYRQTSESASCLSAEEKKLYDLIMEYRKANKLGIIPLSEGLTRVAQTHARDLSENYTFDPKSKCNPHSWSTKGNWSACCYTNDHQKAACMWSKPKEIASYPGNGFEIAYYSSLGANAQEGIEGWKISPGHNPLLINSGTWARVTWKAIGIGIYKEYGLVWFGEVADEKNPELCK